MLRTLANFIYPPHCAACARRLPADSRRRVCSKCTASIDRLHEPLCGSCGLPIDDRDLSERGGWCRACVESPPHFSAARAVARYKASDEERSTIGSIIRRHKYGRDQSLGRALVECLGDPLPLAGNHYDLVIPVPLHRRRLRWRGFNQAAILADAVARRLQHPLDVSTLIRVRSTDPQTARDRKERHRNVRDAFAVRAPAHLASRMVLLIDDVMTTGATADECARTLLEAGARRVDVLTFARVL
jgi:ComF family protein